MLVAAICAVLAVCAPQGSQADAPTGLTIVVVDVGQGDGIVLRAPNGTVHVVDAGPGGQGTIAMLPAIGALQPSGYGFTFLSHFHEDHLGGLDEVRNALPFGTAYDRGDLNRPSNTGVNNYLAAAGAQRQQVALGAVYQLGGGASVRVIAYDGNVLGGAFVDPTSSAQEENSRSLVLRVEYGQFSMWLGGDLTGGGSGTGTTDVESAATLACGDVDVYKMNHHGSNTSSSLNLVARLQPELAVVSCGFQNSYGHPNSAVVNRLNQAAAARALLSTTTGSANTIGFGVAGSIRIDTDGRRYRASAPNGSFLDFWCDELATPPVATGELRISEVHRNPANVPDTNGEYVEVVNVGSKPLGLRGVRLVEGTNTITLASNFVAVPGRPLLFQVDGASDRNGDQPLGMALPFGTFSLGDSADTLALTQGTTTLDSLAYSAGFPGGSGVAAERRNLFGAQNAANYAAATAAFGAGDLGSPGRANDADSTVHPVQCAVTVATDRVTLHATSLEHGGSHISALLVSFADAPATPFGGALIPLAADAAMETSLSMPGFLQFLPPGGYRSLDVVLPQPNPLAGMTLYAAHVVLDLNLLVPGVSPAVPFVLP